MQYGALQRAARGAHICATRLQLKGEITYPFLEFNGATFGNGQGISSHNLLDMGSHIHAEI